MQQLTIGQDESHKSPRQRDLAEAAGLSLGMTNSILKRLAGKGYITLKKINGRTMQYAVTPEGTREIARRSYRYMRRTIGNVARWKHSIDHAVIQAKHNGAAAIQLIGDSDLAFMVEHSCQRHGLRFTTSPHSPAHSPAQTGKAAQAVFVSEHHEPPQPSQQHQHQPDAGIWYIQEIITRG